MFDRGEALSVFFIYVETVFADKFYHFLIFICSILKRSDGMMEWTFSLGIDSFLVEIGLADDEFNKIFGVIDDGKIEGIMTCFFFDFIDTRAMVEIPLEHFSVLSPGSNQIKERSKNSFLFINFAWVSDI